MKATIPVFFHPAQLDFKPLYEWAFGQRVKHPETTRRAESIVNALKKESYFEIFEPTKIPLSMIRQTHKYHLVTLYNAAASLPEGETYYPRLFPKQGLHHADPHNIEHAGFYCIDAGTPLNAMTWNAASWSAACAVHAAQIIEKKEHRVAYSLSRPPGHHSSREYFGGYCYFNNAAMAAKVLRKKGRVALFDNDFHHGNGTQDIFYKDDQVLFLSVHGDPNVFYPLVTGYAQENGSGAGEGFNLNYPLPAKTDYPTYKKCLKKEIIPNIQRFDPDYLVISAGFDTYHQDPVGDFTLETDDYYDMGTLLGRLKKPTLVVQEGGYFSKDLGKNVVSFLNGVRDGNETGKQYSIQHDVKSKADNIIVDSLLKKRD